MTVRRDSISFATEKLEECLLFILVGIGLLAILFYLTFVFLSVYLYFALLCNAFA